jgi:hypothetical protein
MRNLLICALTVIAVAVPAQTRRRALDPGLAQRNGTTPRAVADGYGVTQGASISVAAASGVLANDTDPQRRPLIAILLTNPIRGTVTFNPNGGFVYTHDGSAWPTDTFTYKASNGTYDSAAATVTINVTAAALPVASSDGYTLAHGGSLNVSAPGVLGNDSGGSGGTFIATAATAPVHGTLVVKSDGSFVYTHDGSNTVSDSFTYRVSTGAAMSSPALVSLSISADIAPAVASQVYAATQDTRLVVAAPGVLAGATDPDSRNLSAVIQTQPAHGALALAADGSFTFTPAIGYAGPDSFTYRASDGIFTSPNLGTATITIAGSALANADSYAAGKTSGRSEPAPGLLANDALAGGAILSYGASTAREQMVLGAPTPTSAGGSVSVNANGSFNYTPPPAYLGFDAFRYMIGTAAASSVATVTLTVVAPPAVQNDAWDAAMNTPRYVGSPGVLGNDVSNGAMLTISSPPQHGLLTLNADGSLMYTPLGGYAGPDVFAYSLSNFAGTAVGVVTLTIYAAPLAVGDIYANASSSPFAVPMPAVLGNDSANFASIIAYGKGGSEQTTLGQPSATTAGGSVSLSANGGFTYAPPAGGQTSDSFKYTLANYAGSSTAAVTITSTAAPVAANDTYQVTSNTPRTVAAKGVLENDTPNGGRIASYGASGIEQTAIGANAGTVQGGTIALNADGGFTYKPPTLFIGVDSFRYALSNVSGSSFATVVLNVNAAPVAVNDIYNATLGVTLAVPFPGVIGNDATGGIATIASYGVTGIEQTSIGQPAATTAGGTVSLNADGSFSYRPAAVGGADTFQYTLSSFAGSSKATVTITVGTLPVAVGESYPVAANGSRSEAAPGVLKNDTANNGAISSYGASSGVEQLIVGAATLTAQGGTIALRTDGSFVYIAPQGFSGGTDTFNYRLTNASGSVTATVSFLVSGAPAAVNDSYATSPNTRLDVGGGGITVLKNDVVNNATIASFGVNGNEQVTPGASTPTAQKGTVTLNADGSFSYMPFKDFAGTDTFRYTLTNFIGSSTAAVTIVVSLAPVAAADAYDAAQNTPRTVAAKDGVLANDATNSASIFSYGANGNEQTAIGQQTGTLHGGTIALSADGSFIYRPPAAYAGSDTFAYMLKSAAGSSTATVTFTVWAPPVAVNDTTYRVAAGQTLTVLAADGVLKNDAQNDAAIAGYGKASGTEVGVGQATPTATGGSVSLNADGSFVYSRTDNVAGTDTFRYTLTNYAGTSTATVTITVTLAPIANGDTYSAAPNTTRSVPAPGVLGNDAANGGAITAYGIVGGPQQTAIGNAAGTAHGQITLGADGSFVYKPNTGFTGEDEFQYTLGNAAGNATAVVKLEVFGLPVPVDDAYQTGPGQQLVIGSGGRKVTDNDAVNNATITSYGINGNEQTAIGQPIATTLGGTIALNGDGSFTYTPPTNLLGSDSFRYTLTNFVGNAIGNVTIGVSALPLPQPDAYDAALNTTRSVPAASGVLANDLTNAGTIFSYGPNTGAEVSAIGTQTDTKNGGKITLSANGSFTYVPKSGATGADSFTYALKNGAGTNQATVAFHVYAPPVVTNDAYDVALNATRNEPVAGVLANDLANEGTIVSYGVKGNEQMSAGQPAATAAGGFIALNADGSFNYSAPPNVKGADSFRYTVSNFAGSPIALAVITLWAPPRAVDDAVTVAARTTSADSALSATVFGNDTRNDAPLYSYGIAGSEQKTIGADAVTSHGTVRMNVDGTFVYNPAINFAGTDVFRYTLENPAGGQSVATVTLTVVKRPLAADHAYDLLTNTPLVITAPGVLLGAQQNGATITSFGRTGTEQAPGQSTTTVHGQVTLRDDGSFNYSPAADFAASDAFLYVLSNAAGNATGTITLNVWSPPVAVNDTLTLAGNSLQTVNAPGVMANDVDHHAQVVRFGPATGDEGPAGTPQTTAHGTVNVFADGHFTYQSTVPTYDGPDSFAYKISNFAGAQTATVSLTIVAAAQAVGDAYDTARGASLTIASRGVLANDSPASAALKSDGVTGVEITTPFGQQTGTTAGGRITLNSDGSFTYAPPSAAFFGDDSFKYTVTNVAGTSTATVTLHVIGPADAVDDPNYKTNMGVTLTINAANGVLPNDAPTGTLTIASYGVNGTEQTQPGQPIATQQNGRITLNSDGSFMYTTPSATFYGADTFKYTVRNITSTDVATVTIRSATPPVANPDPGPGRPAFPLVAALDILLMGNDVVNGATVQSYGINGTERTPTAPTDTVRGNAISVESNGLAHVGFGSQFVGDDTFKYVIANDLYASAPASVSLIAGLPMATNHNSYPKISSNAAYSGSSLLNGCLPAGMTTVQSFGDFISGSRVNAGQEITLFGGHRLTVYGNGTFTLTPTTGSNGLVRFFYTIGNQAGSSTGFAQIRVGSAGFASIVPVAGIAFNTPKNVSSVLGDLNDYLGGDYAIEADGHPRPTTGGGKVFLFPDGTFVYTPAIGFTGDDTFIFDLRNPDEFVTITVTLHVS